VAELGLDVVRIDVQLRGLASGLDAVSSLALTLAAVEAERGGGGAVEGVAEGRILAAREVRRNAGRLGEERLLDGGGREEGHRRRLSRGGWRPCSVLEAHQRLDERPPGLRRFTGRPGLDRGGRLLGEDRRLGVRCRRFDRGDARRLRLRRATRGGRCDRGERRRRRSDRGRCGRCRFEGTGGGDELRVLAPAARQRGQHGALDPPRGVSLRLRHVALGLRFCVRDGLIRAAIGLRDVAIRACPNPLQLEHRHDYVDVGVGLRGRGPACPQLAQLLSDAEELARELLHDLHVVDGRRGEGRRRSGVSEHGRGTRR
jgi:hypothetical protein